MEPEADEWLVYHPPKSVSFGHVSTVRAPGQAWSAVEQFMRTWTKYSLGHHIHLTCRAPNRFTDAEVAATRINEARALFGPETNSSPASPSWKLDESQIASAVRFAFDNDKFPKQELPPASFSFSYVFLWNEFDAPHYISADGESRDLTSMLGVSIGNRQGLFLQPYFKFPKAFNSESLQRFLDRLEPSLPFRFRDQYFKRWLSPKGRTYGRTLNLDENWRHTSSARH